jgi:putative acetyltransferase
MHIIRTSSNHEDFQLLASQLEQELRIRDGEAHEYYAQINQVSDIPHALLAYEEGKLTGCGAIRAYDDTAMEIKRMYVPPAGRGKGIATALLQELEKWARELGYTACVLETGSNQPEAVSLYQKHQYRQIPKFGRYVDSDNSVCFRKEL